MTEKLKFPIKVIHKITRKDSKSEQIICHNGGQIECSQDGRASG
jgi:hypothetical protein